MAFGIRSSYANDVAHSWAHQHKDRWSKNNMFYEGKIIYSYGYHFPIARLMPDGTVLFTTSRYSNTTARHIATTRDSVSHHRKIYCPMVPTETTISKEAHQKNISQWISDAEEVLKSLSTARKPEKYMTELHHIQNMARTYIEYFKLKLKKAESAMLFTEDIEGYKEGLAKQKEADARKQSALVRQGKKMHPLWLDSWRAFNEYEFGRGMAHNIRSAIAAVERSIANDDQNFCRLRTDGNEVFTGKGIQMAADIAKRYYLQYLSKVEAGGCTKGCKMKMLDFEVKEITAEHLWVGCHLIPRSEIEYIAKKLGWKTTVAA